MQSKATYVRALGLLMCACVLLNQLDLGTCDVCVCVCTRTCVYGTWDSMLRCSTFANQLCCMCLSLCVSVWWFQGCH